jgi:hypothetical protein
MNPYRRKIEADNATNRARSRAGRDIAADYPPPGDLGRRRACERDFRLFCEAYFPAAFSLPWSADHLRVIARMQAAILGGGLFALAMPRGAGKTTLCERAALWALLYGHRRFVCLVGATEAAAETLLEHLKTELLSNDRLAEDFRQVCHPVRRLENNARRCVGQLFGGERTAVVWGAKRITFPTMPDSACDGTNVSGATVTVAGLTGALRGQSHALPGGEVVRPELVILDDPQTRESALSPTQTNERLSIVQGDVLGMAGPGRRITALMPCTVICEGDLADRLLNRERNPQWQGERTQAVYTWPANEALWAQYLRLRAEALRRGSDPGEATAFYAAHREPMDAGAVIAWPARHHPDELSAVQHVINLRADLGGEAFAAEYQNDPLRAAPEGDDLLTADAVADQLGGVPRQVVPARAGILTAFIDVHDQLLFYCVAAWSADFTGWVVDYGTHPRQRQRAFALRKATPTLADVAPGAGREGAIRAGLDALANALLGREWQREDGARLRIDRCLVDAGYVPDTVFDFCRHSPFANVLLASRGAGVGAASRPMSEYSVKPGERHGWYWLVAPTANRATRYARFDANFWKSFVHGRLRLAVGDPGALSLFGSDPEEHRLFAQHVTAEAPVRVTANGRTVDEWRLKPGVADNHWLDAAVGCAVAASMAGAAPPGKTATPVRLQGRRRVSYLEMQRQAQARGLYRVE